MSPAPGPAPAPRILLLTALAMLAFAANSLLCRLALAGATIDAASFSGVRLAAGALALALMARLPRAGAAAAPADWVAAAMLFAYVACFSFAYRSLSAGTGALILFGFVQFTMFVAGLRAGERFRPLAWAGFLLAAFGLVYLVAPGVNAPPAGGAGLMAAAGLAWGVYSLRGRGVADPLAATAGNFLRATPMALALWLLAAGSLKIGAAGAALAIASGAVTSGLGYVIWYAALRGLSALRAATVQLAVPPIAALAGVLWLGERFTARLGLASLAILGGIALVLLARAAVARPRPGATS